MEVIVFPDAAAIVIGHLAGELDPPVLPRIPNPRPDTFVTVQRVGGPRRNLVTDAATLAIEAWAPTEEAAHDLAQLARGHVAAMVGDLFAGVPVYRVDEFSGPQLLPDPTSDQPRYTFTVAVATRGAA